MPYDSDIFKRLSQGVADTDKKKPAASKRDPEIDKLFASTEEAPARPASSVAAERAEMFSIERPKRAPAGEKELGIKEKWGEIKEEGVVPFVPFASGVSEAVDISKIASSAKRLEAGTASDEDKTSLIKYTEDIRAKQYTTPAYKILDTVAAMPAFMGEFLLTGGVYAAGRKATTKAATKTLQKYLGATGEKILKSKMGDVGMKMAAGTAGATLQTPFMGAPRIVKGTIERSMPKLQLSESERGDIGVLIAGEGEDLVPAFLKSFGDQWAETVSEHSGGLFAMMGRAAKNTAVKSGLLSSFIKANPAMPPNKAVATFRKMGYHGVLNEMMEERLGEVLRAGIGVQEYSLPTMEQLGVELVAFSIPGTIQGVGSMAIQRKQGEPVRLKKETMGKLREVFDRRDMGSARFIDSVKTGYVGGLFDTNDIEELGVAYPPLKKELVGMQKEVKNDAIKSALIESIDAGMTTGNLFGHEFTDVEAVSFVAKGIEGGVLTDEDIRGIKQKHPSLNRGINTLAALKVESEVPATPLAEQPPYDAFEPLMRAVPPKKAAEVTKKEVKELPPKEEIKTEAILASKDKPWKTTDQASAALMRRTSLKKQGITEETHEVVPVEGGFGIQEKVEAVEPAEPVEEPVKLSVKEPAKAEVPEFKSTNDALDFGKVATPEQAEILKAKQEEQKIKGTKARESGDLQLAMDEAVKGQFFREALEVYEKKAEPDKEPAKPEIPTLKNTGDALTFGGMATAEEVVELKAARKVQLTKVEEARKAGDLQLAMDEAVQGQFYREAIEAYEQNAAKGKALEVSQESLTDQATKNLAKMGKQVTAGTITREVGQILRDKERADDFAQAEDTAAKQIMRIKSRERFMGSAIKKGLSDPADSILVNDIAPINKAIEAGKIQREDVQTLITEAERVNLITEENAKKLNKELAVQTPVIIDSLLKRGVEAGVNVEMEVEIEETGDVLTVTKDAAVAMREVDTEINKYEKLLQCVVG